MKTISLCAQASRLAKLQVASISIVVTMFCSATAGDIPRDWRTDSPRIVPSAKVAATTDTVPASNSSVDIIYHPPNLWVATAKGVSQLLVPGNEWTNYNTDDGLGADEIPAVAVFPSGVWASTSHTEEFEGRLVRFGDGIFWFDERTNDWNDRSPADGQASSSFMLAYDLAELRGRIYAACFAGGLVASGDDGANWTNVFSDNIARNDFVNETFQDLNNRYFSVVVDTTVPESAAVYAGTAYGINKFIFLNDTLKVTGEDYADLHMDGSTLWAATARGIVRATRQPGAVIGYYWKSFYQSTHGLPSDNVTAIAAKGDTVWAGFASADGSTGLGLAYSTNNGSTWSVTAPFEASGGGRVPQAILITRGRVWVACENEGVIHTGTAGGTWERAIGGPSYSLAAFPEDTAQIIFIGQNIGVYPYPVAGAPLPGATTKVGSDADSLGQKVVAIGVQKTPCIAENSVAIWALCEGPSGGPFIRNGFAVSLDTGVTWDVSSRRFRPVDFVFEDCQFWLATDSGLASGQVENLDSVQFSASLASLVSANRIGSQVRCLAGEIGEDASGHDLLSILWAGTDSLAAYSANKGQTGWAIAAANRDSSKFDDLEFFRYRDEDSLISGFEELSGNFVTALAFQPGGRGAIWAATQATGQGRLSTIFVDSDEENGISVTHNAGTDWSVVLTGVNAWNFAFDGPVVWAAASEGLYRSSNSGFSWDRYNHFVDPNSGAVIDSNIEIFAVEVVDDEIWAGTENGTVILTPSGETKAIRRTFKPVQVSTAGGEGGAYVTPVPFSPNLTPGGMRFHYVPPTSGAVTIKVYDYANNLVKTVTDGANRNAGQQYDESDSWDGRNGEGDLVAVGTYFFVIEYDGGKTHWGKLVIIP